MLLSLLSKRSLHDDSRDTYGFTVRPQHLHRYREYAHIYREEEEERLHKWKNFLEQQAQPTSVDHCDEQRILPVVSEVKKKLPQDSAQPVIREGDDETEERHDSTEQRLRDPEITVDKTEPVSEECDSNDNKPVFDTPHECVTNNEAPSTQHAKSREVKKWAKISPSLYSIEHVMSVRVKKRKLTTHEDKRPIHNNLPSINESISDESSPRDNMGLELEFLVQGGVPKDLRGEVWQAFAGVRTRRIESYYQNLLATDEDAKVEKSHLPEKCRKQIEKDLPRTFPGHPALNDNGRNSLRRVLSAYARHNPSVGYCQAMNFFAGLLLLMMPEENAFWTLVGMIDDYFEDYFSEEMIESQVDQLVFEDLMRERFPKLVNHLDYLGVQVAWISGPWFLSIFVNMLPWESVLRVWDVLLFEGNRVMLFRTALALMELYGPALITTKDAGDAITLLQTLVSSTFDSSQLVLTACMGFSTITEDRLQELRKKHRPAILEAVEERSKVGRVFKDPKGLATKLYSFKHDPKSIVKENKTEARSGDKVVGELSDTDSHPANFDEYLEGITVDSELDSIPDVQEQVIWLKAELCRLLEEKRSAVLRAEELEAAFMEMVEQDNRRELTARIEQLEQEVAELKQALSDKREQENAMIQVMMKVENEQRVTEDARLSAEQEAAAHKNAVHFLQEKYEKAMTSVAELEKRVVMAESMLEATLQYESGQSKAALSSPRIGGRPESPHEAPKRGLLSFGLGSRSK